MIDIAELVIEHKFTPPDLGDESRLSYARRILDELKPIARDANPSFTSRKIDGKRNEPLEQELAMIAHPQYISRVASREKISRLNLGLERLTRKKRERKREDEKMSFSNKRQRTGDDCSAWQERSTVVEDSKPRVLLELASTNLDEVTLNAESDHESLQEIFVTNYDETTLDMASDRESLEEIVAANYDEATQDVVRDHESREEIVVANYDDTTQDVDDDHESLQEISAHNSEESILEEVSDSEIVLAHNSQAVSTPSLFNNSDEESALEEGEIALEENEADERWRIRALLAQGDVSEFEDAKGCYERARDLAKASHDEISEAEAYLRLVVLGVDVNQNIELAEALARKNNTQQLLAKALLRKALLLTSRESGLACVVEAIRITKTISDDDILSAEVFYTCGKLSVNCKTEYFKAALDLIKDNSNARALHARILIALSELRESPTEYAHQGLDIAVAIKNLELQCRALISLGYRNKGEVEFYSKALDLAERIGNRHLEARVLIGLGNAISFSCFVDENGFYRINTILRKLLLAIFSLPFGKVLRLAWKK